MGTRSSVRAQSTRRCPTSRSASRQACSGRFTLGPRKPSPRLCAAALGAGRGDAVVDLYAGAGLFSVLMADDVGRAGSVLAVERDRRACADAEYNGQGPSAAARASGRRSRPTSLRRASASPTSSFSIRREKVRARRSWRHCTATPPRCDDWSTSHATPPLSVADLRVAARCRLDNDSLRAFDIFPMTEHVELVAALEPPSKRPGAAYGWPPTS